MTLLQHAILFMQVFHINYSLSSTNTIIDTCFTNRKKKRDRGGKMPRHISLRESKPVSPNLGCASEGNFLLHNT